MSDMNFGLEQDESSRGLADTSSEAVEVERRQDQPEPCNTAAPTNHSGMMLGEAMLFAPWCAVVSLDQDVIHRVEMEGIPVLDYETATHATAVCGAQVKLIETRWTDLRTRGTKLSRCPGCRSR